MAAKKTAEKPAAKKAAAKKETAKPAAKQTGDFAVIIHADKLVSYSHKSEIDLKEVELVCLQKTEADALKVAREYAKQKKLNCQY